GFPGSRPRLPVVDAGARARRRCGPGGPRSSGAHPRRPLGAAALAGLLVDGHRTGPGAAADRGSAAGRAARRAAATRSAGAAPGDDAGDRHCCRSAGACGAGGLHGPIRLVVKDGTVPAGSCRAVCTWIVAPTEGTVGVSQEAAVDADPTNPSGSADLGAAVLDIHAASLLLTGRRMLADARR